MPAEPIKKKYNKPTLRKLGLLRTVISSHAGGLSGPPQPRTIRSIKLRPKSK